MITEYRNLFRNKNFIALTVSQVLSQVTIQLLNFLLLFEIFNQTNSAIAVSILFLFYVTPIILIGPLSTVFIDRHDRKSIIVYSNLLQSIVILIFAFTFQKSVYIMYLVVFAYSSLNQFYVPTEQASLVYLLKKPQLPSANGIFFLNQQLAVIIGFTIASMIEYFLGFKASLLFSSILLFIAFIAVLKLPKMKPNINFHKKVEDSINKFFNDILSGYKYITGNIMFVYTLILMSVLQVSLMIIVVNIPIIVKNLIGIPGLYGRLLLIIPTMFGAIASTYYTPRFLREKTRKVIVIIKGCQKMFLSLFILSIITIFITNDSLKLLIIVLGLFMIGFSYVQTFIPAQTFIQEKTPDYLRGRVFGNYWLVISIVSLIPVIFSGLLIDLMGIQSLVFFVSLIFGSISIFTKNRKDYFQFSYDK